MSMLSLRLPESLHRKVRELAAKESISINQFITTAVAEKMAALLTEEYLEERARRADPAAFDRILARVPDVPPLPGDELLHVLEGEIDVTVLSDAGPMEVPVRAGSVFVVPRGVWHRPVARSGVTLFSATSRPTEVSFATDPRREGQAE